MGDRRVAGSTASGILDKAPEKPAPSAPDPDQKPKENFLDPFAQQKADMSNKIKNMRKPPVMNESDSAAQATANALNQSGPGKNVESELDELDKISEADIKLAEEMIFKGYTEFDAEITNMKGHKFTICSTSAEEISIIDEIIFDMVNKAESKEDSQINLPQQHVNSMRNALFVALSYRGADHEELSEDTTSHLNTIKHTIMKISSLESMGEMERSEKLKISLKKALTRRALLVKRLPTPLIDFLSTQKADFEDRMYRIMNSKNILSKS